MSKMFATTLAFGLICALTAVGVSPVAQAVAPEEQLIVVDGGFGPIGIIIIIEGPSINGPPVVSDDVFGDPGGGPNPPTDPVKTEEYEELPS